MKKFEMSKNIFINYSKHEIDNIRNDKYKLLDRGFSVVREDLRNDWEYLILWLLSLDDRYILYNCSTIEASLECMELLNNGMPVEDVYEVIDVHDKDYPCICCGVELSGWQNLSATNIIVKYHERGKELEEYRNRYINNLNKKLSRKK